MVISTEPDSSSAVVKTEINVIMETGDRPGDVTGAQEVRRSLSPGLRKFLGPGEEVRGSLGMR